ncbi:helix-turn-helix transcriptional regulator [Clostridium sp. UBA4548]|uniref:helix-turn-helix transcriptional regulator n=1 Tax=Clostridium sp. UBA4548 TaxID=1946361 RepID=UPI0025C41999|nr:helix-turn-helix transcriptional regulator [Clostridium sp. UBA4548]
MKLSARQEEIIKLVKENQPITSEALAAKLGLTRSALRPDLAILTMSGYLEARPKVGYIFGKKPSEQISKSCFTNIKVKDVMSKPTVVSEETTVYQSILNLFLNDAGTLFVENNGNLVGAVSRKDFIKMVMGTVDIHRVPVGIIMTRMPNIVYVYEEESVLDAAKKIIERQVDSLPVVQKVVEQNKEVFKIVGKVSKTTITQLFVTMGEDE